MFILEEKDFEGLTEYQRKRLTIASECANDIEEYEKSTGKTTNIKIKQILLDMYFYGLDNNISTEEVFELFKKQHK